MGVGLIARDHEGRYSRPCAPPWLLQTFVVSCNQNPPREGTVVFPQKTLRNPIFDIAVAEAFAAWKVVKFSKDMGFLNVFVERDALKIVHAWQKEGRCGSRYGKLIDDAKAKHNSFQSWLVGHLKRVANFAVHCLAKAATNLSLERVWMKDFH